MKHALIQAGVRIPPLNKRIWLWLRDHPAQTYKAISAALGEKHSGVSSVLTNMNKRGMLTVTQDESRGRNGQTFKVTRYSVKFKEWELLPKPAQKLVSVPTGEWQVLRPPEPILPPKTTAPAESEYQEFLAFRAFQAMKARVK